MNFSLGLLWQSNRGMSGARRLFYLKALELNPRHAGAWNNLGVLASKRKAWPEAQRCFAKALEIDPSDAKTWYLQARAYAEQGQWDKAETSNETALRLLPGQKEFQELAGEIASRGPLPAE